MRERMFKALKRIFRRKSDVPAPVTAAEESVAEPVSAPVGRPKIYETNAERMRAFRKRKTAAAGTAPKATFRQ